MQLSASDNAVERNVSRRHLVSRAAVIGTVMRHTANLLVAVVAAVDHDGGAQPWGRLLMGALGVWALYRLLTRSPGPEVLVVDFALTIAVCVAIPLLVDSPTFYLSNSVPVAVAGTAVIGFTVALPLRWSLPAAMLIAASYAVGAASVIGWHQVADVFNLYYFGLQWGTCALIRVAELRVASAVDAARAQRHDAEVAQRVSTAVRDYDREQLRLLHDTVASTLLLVGQGSPLSPERLAHQARRDLEVLGDPYPQSTKPVELVSALTQLTTQHHTAARVTGVNDLWVDADIGRCVVAVTREALNNVDRHAHATAVTLDVAPGRIVVSDDGRGLDAAAPRIGYGITHSMTARMDTLGGSVGIDSVPGRGTTTTLTWPRRGGQPPSGADAVDPDQLIDRTRTGYALSLTAYAVLSLSAMAPAALPATSEPIVQILIAVAAALITLSAIPHTLRKKDAAGFAPHALLALAMLQTAALPATAVGGQAQWSQASIGWCILPFLLREPPRRAATQLVGAWAIVGVFTFLRSPTADTAANLGLGTASILAIQLCALLFSSLIATAAREAHAELQAHTSLVAAQRITSAVQLEYRRRYARLLDNVRPLLEAWRDGTPVTTAMRIRAAAESRRLRVLFGQSSAFDNAILAGLRAAMDTAEGRGVDVDVDVHGVLPSVCQTDARTITAPLIRALDLTESRARITILVLGDVLKASAVCQGIPAARVPAMRAHVSDEVTVIEMHDVVWIAVSHPLPERTTS